MPATRRLTVGAVLCALMTVAGMTHARADSTETVAKDGTIGATVSTGASGGSGGSGGSGPTCTYDEAAGTVDEVVKQIDGTYYVLHWRTCGSAMTGVWIPELDGADLAELAVDEVRRRLPAPVTRLAPAPDRLVTQLNTWIWTDPSTWQPVTATAALPTLSATVTARPVRLRFDPGDGAHGTGQVTCTGPGQPWRPEHGDAATSPCSYTYRHSSDLSASGRWSTATSIEWEVTYRVSDGGSGSLGPLTTQSALTVTVNELQALVASHG